MGSEDDLKISIYKLNIIAVKCNIKISKNKIKILEFNSKGSTGTKIVTDNCSLTVNSYWLIHWDKKLFMLRSYEC